MNVLTGNHPDSVLKTPPLFALSDLTLDFLKQLSSLLLAPGANGNAPELIALGFWLRRANLTSMTQHLHVGLTKPLGNVLHVTPNNVDTMFVYSWVCSLLMGNNNIIRVSNADAKVKRQLIAVLKQVIDKPEFHQLKQRNSIIEIDYQTDYWKTLNAVVQSRVVWGGDQTINAMKELQTMPRCRDVYFADRHSAALINGDALNSDNLADVADKLMRDSLPYGQQACSSPISVFWLGNETLKHALFELCSQIAQKNDNAVPWRTTNHLVVAQWLASQQTLDSVQRYAGVTVLQTQPTESVIAQHCGDNLFFLKPIEQLAELAPYCVDKLQTLSYWGVDKTALIKFLSEPSITGCDRVIPLGQALSFSTQWDGYELFSMLSRRIVIN